MWPPGNATRVNILIAVVRSGDPDTQQVVHIYDRLGCRPLDFDRRRTWPGNRKTGRSRMFGRRTSSSAVQSLAGWPVGSLPALINRGLISSLASWSAHLSPTGSGTLVI